MTKGWISESARHALAAKKIKTGRKATSAKYKDRSGDYRYTNTNWRQIKKDKNIIEWESDQEKRSIQRLGDTWMESGGSKLENISYAPSFYDRKKDALRALKSYIEFKGVTIIPKSVWKG